MVDEGMRLAQLCPIRENAAGSMGGEFYSSGLLVRKATCFGDRKGESGECDMFVFNNNYIF